MSKLSTLSWGLYLSSSWTWCIGMFLPVILLQRYGLAGYLVFAIPNVIGCTAFGYVMGNPERSRNFVARHTKLMMAFSLVTIIFHFYFLLMLLRIHDVGLAICLLLVLVTVVLLIASLRLSMRSFLCLALLSYGASLVAGSSLFDTEFLVQGSQAWYEAFYLLPLTGIGFLLCPYFDLTFHKALQCAPSKHSFAVFGVSFVPMILITVFYQDIVLEAMPILLLLHLGGQALFSMGVHAKELSQQISVATRTKVLSVSCALLLMVGAVMLWPNQTTQFWLDNYLRFFVFYGVVFPALLIATAIDKKHYPLLLMSVLIALPFLELGVIAQISYLAIVPAVIVLYWAWLAVVKGKPEPISRPSHPSRVPHA